MSKPSEITLCLQELRQGSDHALDRLVALLYDDLRQMAQQQLRNRGSGVVTLNPTALVHEAYMRLANQTRLEYEDRNHFYAVCAVVMRNIVVDYARKHLAKKRGGGKKPVTLNESLIGIDGQAEQIVALHSALDQLAKLGKRLVQVVECRFFAGLSEAETADALSISERTVRRDWTKSKTLLLRMMEGGAEA